MKIGIFGDLHITDKAPEGRIDNYIETQLGKFKEAMEIFTRENCEIIIQVGDFTDRHNIAPKILIKYAEVLQEYQDLPFLVIWGQHDLSGHSKYSVANSYLKLLSVVKRLHILDKHFDGPYIKDDIAIYGASFGEPIPSPLDWKTKNILVTHQMIGDRLLYPGQELINPRNFLKDHKYYTAVFCGDYHYRFLYKWNQVIANPGALMRKTRSKFDLEHKPGVLVFDTNTLNITTHLLTIKPADEVFAFTNKKLTENKMLTAFLEALPEANTDVIHWRQLLVDLMAKENTSEDVKQIISQVLEEAEHI